MNQVTCFNFAEMLLKSLGYDGQGLKAGDRGLNKSNRPTIDLSQIPI